MKKLLAVLAVVALGACSSSNPVAPQSAKVSPTHSANSRYILVSGKEDAPPFPGCYAEDGWWVCPD